MRNETDVEEMCLNTRYGRDDQVTNFWQRNIDENHMTLYVETTAIRSTRNLSILQCIEIDRIPDEDHRLQ